MQRTHLLRAASASIVVILSLSACSSSPESNAVAAVSGEETAAPSVDDPSSTDLIGAPTDFGSVPQPTSSDPDSTPSTSTGSSSPVPGETTVETTIDANTGAVGSTSSIASTTGTTQPTASAPQTTVKRAPSSSTPSSTPTTAKPTTTTKPPATTVAAGPGSKTFAVDAADASPPTFNVALGTEVTLTITSAIDQEFHLHDIDLTISGTKVTFRFTADLPGTHIVESHDTGKLICTFVIA